MNKKQEQALSRSVERGEWHSVKNLAIEKRRAQDYARATFTKDRRLNIRISSRDLDAIKIKALQDGIPYQTLTASIIHKYVTGRLIEKSE